MLIRPFLWVARKIWNFWLWKFLPRMSFMRSWVRNPIQVVFSWPDRAVTPHAVTPHALATNSVTLGPRVALFVHFDGGGDVRPYVLHYVRGLHEAGLSVVFVSNAGRLRPEALESIKPFCAGIMVRRNLGYDFAAMREGLQHFALPRPDTELLVIANDSVYGPLRPLGEMLSRIDFERADFWGATESWQSRYHLQSFFLVAGPRLLAHPAWSSFWNSVRPVSDKRWVITRYEVGITQWMIRAGLRCAAVWPYHDLVHDVDPDLLTHSVKDEPSEIDPLTSMRRIQSRRIRTCFVRRIALNPTSDMWRQLLQADFPFLKRELLRDNPTDVHDVMDWRRVVAETSNADVTMIERDLQRLVRNSAP